MSVKFIPVNKMLLIEREQKQQEKPDQFGFVIPDKVDMSKHTIVNLRSASDGSSYERYVGNKIVVVRAMIEEIEIGTSRFQLVSENGVVGIAAESELL